MRWHSIMDDNIKINKLYLVHVVHVLHSGFDNDGNPDSCMYTYLGKFNGRRWNLVDYNEEFVWDKSMQSMCNYEVVEFANLPKFNSKNLIDKPTNGRYLISVKYKGRKRSRIMIGMLVDNCWSVGDVKDAFELYVDEIDDIRVMSIS